jgi:hypothetical protein
VDPRGRLLGGRAEDGRPQFLRVADGGVHERTDYVWRAPGTFMAKRATDRHRIKTERRHRRLDGLRAVPEGPAVGLLHEHGKVYWYDYDRVRDPVEAARTARAEDAVLRRGRMAAISGGAPWLRPFPPPP